MANSDILNQAIIDAGELKNLALKSAEKTILEKYSKEVADAVSTLLEAPGDEELDFFADEDEGEVLPPEPDMGMEPQPVSGEDEEFVDNIPMAAHDGEKLCPCPEEEEEIEINFDDLARQMGIEDESGFGDDARIEDEFLDDISFEDEFPGEEDELFLEEKDLLKLVEETEVDGEPRKNGWVATNSQELDVEALKSDEEEEVGEDKPEKETSKKTGALFGNKKVEESVMKITEKLSILIKENADYLKLIGILKEKLDEVNLSNARLIFSNRVLKDVSLNERQKKKLVDTISEAKTIKEVRTIHKTLQSSVSGVRGNQRTTKSLNEVLTERKPHAFEGSRSERPNKGSDDFIFRMQKLAGIKKL